MWEVDSSKGSYYDPIFMADPKNMTAACMRLYRSKNYGKMHAW
jgi:inosine/xanthosine triphosphate pyrophosphatase family protein